MIVTTVEPTELEILDEIILFLDSQLDAFRGDRKKAHAYKEARQQYSRVKEFRRIVEEGYPLIGLWVRKSNSKASQVVGQIAKIDKDNFWVKYWGSPTPYPESPGLVEIDEFAQATGLKEGGFVRITEGHKVLKEGEVYQVQELQAKGWILTTEGKLIASEFWEVASEEPRQNSDGCVSEIGAEVQAIASEESVIETEVPAPIVGNHPSLKCIIKQPGQPEIEGTILQDLGSNLLVAIAGFDEPVNTPKLWAYPVDSTLTEIAAIYDGDTPRLITQQESDKTTPTEIVEPEPDFPQAFVKGAWFRVLEIQGESVLLDDPYADPHWSLDAVELNPQAIALLNDEQLTAILNTEGDLAFCAASEALQRARKAGVYLLEQKRRIKHGGWLPWIAENCPRISDRTAQVWMKIAKNWDEIRKNAGTADIALDALSIDGAMKLLKPVKAQGEGSPEEVQEEPPENAEAETERDLMAFLDKSVSFSPNKLNWALTNVAIQTRKQIHSLDEEELSILLENCEPLVEAARLELSQRQQKIAS